MTTPAQTILEALDGVVDAYPHAASMLFERARLLDGMGEDARAEAAYRAVIAENAKHFRAHNDLGLLYNRHGLAVNALHCFVAAVEADESNATGHANLGAMLLAGDDVEGARTRFERALELRPDHAGARAGLIAVCERLGLPAPVAAPPPPATPPTVAAPAGEAPDPVADYIYDIAANGVMANEDAPVVAFLDRLAGADAAGVRLLWRVADFAGDQRRFAIARTLFERAIPLDPGNVQLQLGLAIVLDEMGERDAAHALWRSDALRGAVRVFASTTSSPIRVLTIASALHAIRFELFVDPSIMHNTVLYTQCYDATIPLPNHDIVLVAVGDVDSDAEALAIAAEIVTRTTRPVINHPDAVRTTGRSAQASRYGAIPGVRTAAVRSVARRELAGPDGPAIARAAGFSFPFLVRSPGFHNGQFFEYVADAQALATAAASLPTDEVLLMTYLDARSADGAVRKYRVMSIDGHLYPVHLAISREWNVHYVSSAMAGDDAFRAEEAAFLHDMRGSLGERTVDALAAIARTMQLDYGGIDFAVAADGTVLVFEANAAMGVFLPDADPRWDYRRAVMTRALRAATEMLASRAGR